MGQAAELVEAARHVAGAVEAVPREHDDPDGKGDDAEEQVAALGVGRVVAREKGPEGEGEGHGGACGQEIGSDNGIRSANLRGFSDHGRGIAGANHAGNAADGLIEPAAARRSDNGAE